MSHLSEQRDLLRRPRASVRAQRRHLLCSPPRGSRSGQGRPKLPVGAEDLSGRPRCHSEKNRLRVCGLGRRAPSAGSTGRWRKGRRGRTALAPAHLRSRPRRSHLAPWMILGRWPELGARWGAVVAQRNRYQCSVGPDGCASWALPISPGSLLHPYQLLLAAARILGAGVAGGGGVGGSGRTELELPGGTAQPLLLGCFTRQPAGYFWHLSS